VCVSVCLTLYQICTHWVKREQALSILLTSEHDSGDGVHSTSSQCCSAHSSSCRRRHLYTHCWAPLRPTAAHRHTRHWCSRPRTWTTWGVGALVVRGEAKSQHPHLVVYTWRDHLRRPHVHQRSPQQSSIMVLMQHRPPLSGHAFGLAYFLGMSEK